MPLLIGGATTSRVHTAVKIHPNYARGQTVYVTDASRAVGVVQQLLAPETRDAYVADIRAEYAKVADAHARGERDKQRLPLAKARANAPKIDWTSYEPPKPLFTGTRVLDQRRRRRTRALHRLDAVLPDLGDQGPLSRAPRRPDKGEAARALFDDAQAMLARSSPSAGSTPRR